MKLSLPTIHSPGSLWMLVAAFFFAVMGVFVKIGSAAFSSPELVFYRSLFGLLYILALAQWRGLPLRTPLFGKQLTRALLGFIALLMFFYALGTLPLATAMTLNYTSPLFMALFATLLLHHARPRKLLILAMTLGFTGVALLLQPSLRSDDLLAGAIGLGSGMIAGLVYVQVIQLGQSGEPDWRTVFYFTLVCTAGAGGWALLHRFNPVGWADLPVLLGLGASATIAQLAMTRAYRTGNHLVVGSLSYATVLLASFFGALFWNETLSPARWGAIALIVLGGVISVHGAVRRNDAA